MFTVIYITVALLQLSFGHEVTKYDPETQVDLAPIPEPEFIEPLPSLAEDDGDILTTAAKTPLKGEVFEDTDSGESVKTPIDSGFGGTVNAQETDPIATNYGCGENCSGTSDEEEDGVVEVAPKTTIRLSSPVKTDGKVTIVAHIGCEAKETEADDEDVNESIIISVSGPVRAQGKMSIATHYGCEDNSLNSATPYEAGSDDIYDAVPEGTVSFGGSVHAQGKMSVGTHYGCGAPFGIPPSLPMPWFPSYPTYFFPGSYSTPPIANFLANSIPGTNSAEVEDNDFQHENMAFNGIVPACGTVSIAARY